MSQAKYILLFSLLSYILLAQTRFVKGVIKDEKGNPVEFAVVSINTTYSAQTDKNGNFIIEIPQQKQFSVTVRLLGFKEKTIELSDKEDFISIVLETDSKTIQQVEVKADNERREEAGMMKLDPKNAVLLPSAFGDFNKLIQMLPGVVSNNELSSTYSVRGGNYDENLIYVNGIEVYRPFLISSGQQEGLSFVNPNLASDVAFSSGGWQAKYGDKLSSVMNVSYKEPKKFEGSVQGGLLGATAHLGISDKQNRVSAIVGFRNKSSQYLLNTLPVKGQYFPSFNDFQSYINFDLTNRKKDFPVAKRTTLGILGTYAGNRYFVIPETQQTTFGTANEILNLQVGFAGTEKMDYDTWQGGLKFSHWVNPKFRTEIYSSAMKSREREYIDLEAGYRLCDVSPDLGENNLSKCATEKGVGTIYRYARNSLSATVISLENRSYWFHNDKNTTEFGAKLNKEVFEDKLSQWGFIDSVDYVRLTPDYLNTVINLNSNRVSGYLQHTYKIDSVHSLTLGSRLGWWDLNKEFLLSPNAQYSFNPHWKRDYIFRFATGIYRQPPFYRELRNFIGEINKNLKAQSSVHFLGGFDHKFKAWNRTFKLTSEFYGKYLWNVIPYDIDNVRIRYYATNNAIAYATGVDMRVSGEFVKGSESWFSLSVMQTQEKVEGSSQGWIRRPTDQRVNVAIFFQDHIAKIPALKVYLNLVFGTGLPFGVPNDPSFRNVFSIPPYRRLDLGTNYVISFNDKRVSKRFFESIMIGIECLNILGINNTISYIWVADYSNRQYAVPNTLSTQFWNAKVIANF
jgi:hypothetical protein